MLLNLLLLETMLKYFSDILLPSRGPQLKFSLKSKLIFFTFQSQSPFTYLYNKIIQKILVSMDDLLQTKN